MAVGVAVSRGRGSPAGSMSASRSISAAKGRLVRSAGVAAAGLRRVRKPSSYRDGFTVVTVNWNSLAFLRGMLAATRAMSPAASELVVVDNGSSDGSLDFLKRQRDVRLLRLPVNVGHGVALDLAVADIDTEYLAVLDVDAFPISDRWLHESQAALDAGAKLAGARMHRNFVHPCFLVTRTSMLHWYGLTFRSVGSLRRRDTRAPLFLDVGEALSQRAMIKFGGGEALHFFETTSVRGPGGTGAVFGGLVYHNQYATQGEHRGAALEVFNEALGGYHPGLRTDG